MTKPAIPNVLAARYASAPMAELWSPEHKVVLERQLWMAVLRAQRDLGRRRPRRGRSRTTSAVVDKVDLASIDERERVTQHDVKARIEEFSALAGHEHIHKGMTSRDLTENVEQLQVRAALVLVRDRDGRRAGPAGRAGRRARRRSVMTGRSHNVAGAGDDARQALRQRRRGAAAGARAASRSCSPATRCAGIKGPVGTQQDMLDLLGRRRPALDELERRVAAHLGFAPRSTTSARCTRARSTSTSCPRWCRPASGPASLATTIRLMAGLELATEGFQPGQVGSSAMPHKMNSRSCERINGLAGVLRGHLSMVGGSPATSGTRATSRCSVVRRVALPDAFFAADGLFETFLTVLDDFGAYPAVIERELERYLPFLTTTKVLMAAVRPASGARRRTRRSRSTPSRWRWRCARRAPTGNDLLDRLAADDRAAARSRRARRRCVAEPLSFVGTAGARSVRSSARSTAVVAATPTPPPTARTDPLASPRLAGSGRDRAQPPAPVLRQGPGHLRRRRRPAADGHLATGSRRSTS